MSKGSILEIQPRLLPLPEKKKDLDILINQCDNKYLTHKTINYMLYLVAL